MGKLRHRRLQSRMRIQQRHLNGEQRTFHIRIESSIELVLRDRIDREERSETSVREEDVEMAFFLADLLEASRQQQPLAASSRYWRPGPDHAAALNEIMAGAEGLRTDMAAHADAMTKRCDEIDEKLKKAEFVNVSGSGGRYIIERRGGHTPEKAAPKAG